MYIAAQGIREPESSRFLLLALSHTEINFHEISSSKEAENLKGTLCVESITSVGVGPTTPLALEPQDSDEQPEDISLILRVDDVEIVLPRTPLIRYDKASGVLVFTDLVHAYRYGGDVQLIDVSIKLDESYMETDQGVEEAETLEVVLAQYGVLQDYDTKPGSNAVGAVADNLPSSSTFSLDGHGAPVEDLPEDFRGKVVLLDQDNGEVLGTLGDNYRFREDANLNATGNEKGPVMIDLPNEEREGENPEVIVHTVPSDERDYLLQSAKVISSGIVLATSAINTSMSFLSSFYQSHSTPNEKPAVISNRTKSGVKVVHGASGQALKVTHKAVGFIDKGIEKAVEYFDDRSRKGKGRARSNEGSGSRVASPVLLSPMSSTSTSTSTSMSKSAPPTRVASPSPSPLASPIPLASESRKDSNAPAPAPPPYSEYAGIPPPLPSRKISGLEPPPLPKRSTSPSPTTSNKPPPPISQPSSSQPQPSYQPSQQQQQRQSSKKNLLSSLLLSADLLSTTLESSAKSIITTGTDSLSSALKHKYGQETGDATRLLGESVRNVVFVYIDAQGIGRKALLMKAGAGVVRARVGGREVLLTADDQGMVKADEKSGFNGASDI